jgi:hypothetical protein
VVFGVEGGGGGGLGLRGHFRDMVRGFGQNLMILSRLYAGSMGMGGFGFRTGHDPLFASVTGRAVIYSVSSPPAVRVRTGSACCS